MTLRKLERSLVSAREKLDIIDSVRAEQHEYTAFFVCRNPVEKLLSVYHYLMDLRVRRNRCWTAQSYSELLSSEQKAPR